MDRINTNLEVKSFSDDGTFSGYASVFGNIDSHRDVVAKGAFEETLAKAKSSGTWPAMLLMHGMGAAAEDQMPIGVWTEMREDSTGLFVEGKLGLGNRRADDTYALLRMKPRPALNGLSIGYRPVLFRKHGHHEKVRRTLISVHLDEVSIVTRPSNRLATISNVKFSRPADDAATRFTEALRQLAAAA